MTLEKLLLEEERILPKHVFVNPTPEKSWYETINAAYRIVHNKLYRSTHSSLEKYAAARWKTSRSTFYNLHSSGDVISQLSTQGIRELPGNVSICLAIKQCAEKHKKTIVEVWNEALRTFGNSQNVVAHEISRLYPDCSIIPQKRNFIDEGPLPLDDNIEISSNRRFSQPIARFMEQPTTNAQFSAESESSSKSSFSQLESRLEAESMSEGESMSEAGSDETESRRPRLLENEYLTPEWLANCVYEFALPLGGIELNLCGNRDSVLQAKYSYGEQEDGEFVNAFQFDTWKIPKDETETIVTGSKKPKFVFLNAPTRALTTEQSVGTSGQLQPELVRKLMQHYNDRNIEHAIVIAPLDSSKRWQHELLSKALVCLLKDKVEFTRSLAAIERFKENHKDDANAKEWRSEYGSRAIFYLAHEERKEDIERFHKIFGSYGFIAGYNSKCVCGNELKSSLESTTRLQSVFAWAGGKCSLKKKLCYNVKKKLSSGDVYFEPFCGAGSVLLELQPKKARLNDINPFLMLVFQLLKCIPNEFIEHLESMRRPTCSIKGYYKDVLRDFNNDLMQIQDTIPHDLDELTTQQLAGILLPTARFYFLVKFSYGGIIIISEKGMKSSCREENWDRQLYDKELLLAIHKYFSTNDIKFYHGDYSHLLQMCKANDFIYFDPPYYNTNFKDNVGRYSSTLFDSKSHEKLAHECKELVNNECHVMQSNSDYPEVENMYQELGFTINRDRVVRSINKKEVDTELIITSFPV